MKAQQFVYHIKKGFPPSLVLPTKTYLLTYTPHAKQEALKDRYAAKINLPLYLDFSTTKIYKVAVENKIIVKVVCRISYTEKLDLSLVIDPRKRLVITVWLNKNTDTRYCEYLFKYNKPSTF